MFSYHDHDVNQHLQRCVGAVCISTKLLLMDILSRRPKTELDSEMGWTESTPDLLRQAVQESYMKLMARQWSAFEEETDGQKMPTGSDDEDADYQLALELQQEEFEKQHGGQRAKHGDMVCRPLSARWAKDKDNVQVTGEGSTGYSISEDGDKWKGKAVDKGKGKEVHKGKGKAVDKGKGKAVY
ncbi:hypothetical protein BS17DRAFT_775086 [Gyrodon lividus]|nr:hypothetical protein BS17DRAFT_775086 [Gyrodon lividus]